MLPSPAELKYFLEVSASLNLSRASEKLGISQPSLSLAIKRLEHSIGTAVFVRHKHGVSLTQAGKQLLVHARQLLQYWQTTKSQALASQQDIQGCLTLGCHPAIGSYMVAKFLPALLNKYPKLEIHLQHDISRRITERVINLSIDIGIVINPFKHPDLIIRKLCDDEVTFWIGDSKYDIQNIRSQHAVVICDPDLTQTQVLLQTLKKRGIEFNRIIATSNLDVVAALTANGGGIGILPSRVASSTAHGKLKRIAKMPVYSDELCLIYRDENRDIQAVKTVTAAIAKFW